MQPDEKIDKIYDLVTELRIEVAEMKPNIDSLAKLKGLCEKNEKRIDKIYTIFGVAVAIISAIGVFAWQGWFNPIVDISVSNVLNEKMAIIKHDITSDILEQLDQTND